MGSGHPATAMKLRGIIAWIAPLALLAMAALSLMATDASAAAAYESHYTLSQTYSAALRLIRVDNGFKIREQDHEAAYILFDYESNESGSRITPGAIELVPHEDNVSVFVKLPKMPQYHEEVMLNALRRKLESEYGDPPPRRKPRDPDSPPDGGRDAGTDGKVQP